MNRSDLPVTIVRPALVLGERDSSMLPGIVAFLKAPNALYLGNGRNRLPIVYGGDVAELCIVAATSEQAVGQTYNAVNEEYVTQRDFFESAAEYADLRLPKRSLPFRVVYAIVFGMELRSRIRDWKHRPELTRFSANLLGVDYVESAAKAHRELGWKPEVSMREAVRRSVEWASARRAQKVSS